MQDWAWWREQRWERAAGRSSTGQRTDSSWDRPSEGWSKRLTGTGGEERQEEKGWKTGWRERNRRGDGGKEQKERRGINWIKYDVFFQRCRYKSLWEWHISQITVTIRVQWAFWHCKWPLCITALHQSVWTMSSCILSFHHFIFSLIKSIFQEEIVPLWMTDLKVALEVLWQLCLGRKKKKKD